MIKMRDTYHADISNGFNVRVYSTEPPEDLVVRLGHFLYLYISMGLGIQDLKFYNLGSILGSIFLKKLKRLVQSIHYFDYIFHFIFE